MAIRKTPFITGETYHICNRSVMSTPIFVGKREVDFFLSAVEYYIHEDPPVKFSLYRTKPQAFLLKTQERLGSLFAYCVMPTHFHLLLRQEKNDGIQSFIRKASSSFAHYYGLKHHVHGHIFEGNFKAVHIESYEQLLHVSRYIHLNPVTAYIVEDPADYPYSSYKLYMDNNLKTTFVETANILSQFRSPELYKRFVLDQKEYQRELVSIKHLLLDA